jgi:hypothetical protein
MTRVPSYWPSEEQYSEQQKIAKISKWMGRLKKQVKEHTLSL